MSRSKRQRFRSKWATKRQLVEQQFAGRLLTHEDTILLPSGHPTHRVIVATQRGGCANHRPVGGPRRSTANYAEPLNMHWRQFPNLPIPVR